MNPIKNIGIWGDSLLKGIVFDEENGKYRPLKQCCVNLFGKLFPITIKNNSRFGCTAPKALQNLKSSLSKGFHSDVALLEFGGNDCDFNWVEVSKDPMKEHIPHTPLASFSQTMIEMIESLIRNSIKPVLMNLPPIDAERYFHWISHLPNVEPKNLLIWLKEKEVIYRQQERYSKEIERIAYTNCLPLIDVRGPFLAERGFKDYLCVDGIHLNQKGHELMCGVFSNYVRAYV